MDSPEARLNFFYSKNSFPMLKVNARFFISLMVVILSKHNCISGVYRGMREKMTFQEFWPRYLEAHRQPGTRALHYVASSVGAVATFEAYITGLVWIFLLGLSLSYTIAILSHWLIERNQPLIRVNAFWGALANMRMCGLAATNRLYKEYEKYGISPTKSVLKSVESDAQPKNR